MDTIRELKPSVYYVGSRDPQRKYFDQLIPLPEGTSYNSYLIKGSEKTALIDTVYPPREEEILEKLQQLNIKKLDYIIANHGEQDHTGALAAILKIHPEAKIVTNIKAKEIIMDLHHIDGDKFTIIEDGDTLSLGDKTLEFIMAPWVHWPDTMFTYLKESNIIFTCDFFGSHLSDKNLYVEDEKAVYNAAKRYYAEIMMPFAKIFRPYIDKVEELNPDIIAPSHGPIYANPQFIIDAYREWTSNEQKNEVVVLRISMYGSTDKMVNHVLEQLKEKGIRIKEHEALNVDLGELAMDLVNAQGLIIAAPVVLSGPHPNIVSLVYLINILKPFLKYVSIMGSYSWGGMMPKQIQEWLKNLRNTEFLDPLMVKGQPKDSDYLKLDNLAGEIIKRHEGLQ